MLRVIQSVKIMALFFCLFLGITSFAQAGTPMSDRIAVEAGVKTEIAKDLASPYSPHESPVSYTHLTRAYMTPEIRACALSAKMELAPSEAGMRETRSCVRASAEPNVNGLLVLERRRGDLPLTLPDVCLLYTSLCQSIGRHDCCD